MTFVLANPGSALGWVEIGHLVVLNLLIGGVEGWLLARIVRVRAVRAVPIMIFANYFSAWIGAFLLPRIARAVEAAWSPDPPLYHAARAFALLVAIAFAMAVLLELPFVWWAWRGRPRSARTFISDATRPPPAAKRAITPSGLLGVCVIVQTVSYSGMALLYGLNSDLSLLRTHPVRDVAPLAGGTGGWIYYARMADTEVRRVRLDGTGDEHVGHFSLEQFGSYAVEDQNLGILAPECVGTVRGFAHRAAGRMADPKEGDPWPSASTTLDFRGEPERSRDQIAIEADGVSIRLSLTRIDANGTSHPGELNVGWATTTAEWHAGFPTVLPNGVVVLQLGPQVVIVDRSRKIGVLAMGAAPVVVLDTEEK